VPRKQYIVRVRRDDRRTLHRLVRTGHRSAWTIQRARILLAADAAADGPALSDAAVARQEGVSARTVARVRADWATRGLACVERPPQCRPSVRPKFTDAQCLQLAALACTEPPPGFAQWSLRQLRERVVTLEIVESVCIETVRQALKNGGSSRGARSGL
jgi:hypothetical protein